MNVEKILSELREKYEPEITFKIREQIEGKLHLDTHATLEGIDGNILVTVIVYDSAERRTIHVFFTFEKIEPTLKNYELINQFNENMPFYKGYISKFEGNYFFEVHISTWNLLEEDCGTTIIDSIDGICDGDVLKYLKPITQETI